MTGKTRRRVTAGLLVAAWLLAGAAGAQPAASPLQAGPTDDRSTNDRSSNDRSSADRPSTDAPAVPAPTNGPPPTSDANRLDTPAETLRKAGAVIKDLAKGDVPALRRGPLLIHGNYCGIGDRPVLPPVDALDAACMRHDACTKEGALPSCACDERLGREAATIAEDPATTPSLKALAVATAASMAVLVCD